MSKPIDKQMTFNLPPRVAQGRNDFWVSPSNETAVAWIDRYPDWPSPFLIIYGPESSGKTHLKNVWDTKASNGYSVDNVDENIIGDRDREEALFHKFNAMKENGEFGLLTASKPPVEWGFVIPDLRSRLCAQTSVSIDLPDDTLLKALIVKLLSDKQLVVSPDVIEYIVPRVERSFSAIKTLIDRADQMALSRKKTITVPIIRDVMNEQDEFDL